MTRLSKQARTATVIGIVIIFAYVSLSLLFVMPKGVITTVAKPITSAASPYFTQKWNVFSPNIAKTNPKLYMQAQWADDDGERVKSEWVSVTDVDFAAISGHLHPSRAHKTSYNLQTRYYNRYTNLNKEQRAIVRNTFIKRDGEGFAAKTREEITAELGEHGKNSGQIRALLREDDILKEYLTYFSTAYFNKDVIRVRWMIHREYPNKFEERFVEETVRAPTELRFGWRHVDDEVNPEKLDVFVDYINRRAGER